jgi:signal transduction histidine kinase/ActR/RegA family two-component response regulator
MKKDPKTKKELLLEIEDLRIRIDEAEETLSAIRRGEVDGIVVSVPEGNQVFTLKGAERSYRFFVEAMNEGAVTLSPDGTILYCNERFAQMVETPYQKIVGESVYRFISSLHTFGPAFRKGKTERSKAEILLKKRHSELFPASVSFNPMHEDELPSICMVVTDLTEHIRQDQLLREKARQLTRMASQLTLAEQRERRRLAMIIHDHLQQLLVGAKMRLEVLGWDLGKDHQQNLQPILDLLVESLATARSLNTQLSPTVLYEHGLAEGLKWLARTIQETYQVNIDTDIDPGIGVEREDLKALLFEASRELLFNAVKHACSSSVRIKMAPDGAGNLRISISDQGVGFDPEKLMKDLGRDDRFGLFSIRERLELIGGRLKIESSPGNGATFHLIVPMDKATTAQGKFETREVSFETAGFDRPDEAIRVLLADDHVVMRQGLSALLKKHPDIQVVGEAADGEEAVQMARNFRPDVILMDISMPKMNGMEATRVIHSELPLVRIIGLSMYDDAETEKCMLNAGAVAFVPKSGYSVFLLTVVREGNPKNSRVAI